MRQSTPNISTSKIQLIENIKIVLKNSKYFLLFTLITIGMFLILGISMSAIIIVPNQIFFTTSMLAFPGTHYLLIGLTFLFLVPLLVGFSITLNIYRFIELKRNVVKEGSTSFIGAFTSLFAAGCSQCLPILLSFIGVSTTAWLTFFSGFGIMLQLATILLAALSLYFASSRISKECKYCKS